MARGQSWNPQRKCLLGFFHLRFESKWGGYGGGGDAIPQRWIRRVFNHDGSCFSLFVIMDNSLETRAGLVETDWHSCRNMVVGSSQGEQAEVGTAGCSPWRHPSSAYQTFDGNVSWRSAPLKPLWQVCPGRREYSPFFGNTQTINCVMFRFTPSHMVLLSQLSYQS